MDVLENGKSREDGLSFLSLNRFMFSVNITLDSRSIFAAMALFRSKLNSSIAATQKRFKLRSRLDPYRGLVVHSQKKLGSDDDALCHKQSIRLTTRLTLALP